ncbi:hypothetical protein RvY_09651-1 [Ramazzottius varieornatus]|uniref:Uncharacterized protein n=1 Tax=Ramazzottius varieornatus TaxID=947166 RepID=A0A1D1VCH6_RAMVA|nr:hypothetical protein RvY_09651-1 [Ramazzottius varieornatus]
MPKDIGTDSSDSEANGFSASLFTNMGDLFSTFWNKMMRDANLDSWVIGDSSVSPPPSPLELLLTSDIQRAANSTRDSLGDVGGGAVGSAPLQQALDSEVEEGSKSDADRELEKSPADSSNDDDHVFDFGKIDDSVIEESSKAPNDLQREESMQNLEDDETITQKENELATSGTTKRKHENSEPASTSEGPVCADPTNKKKREIAILEFDD